MTQTIQKPKDIIFNSLDSSPTFSHKILSDKLQESPSTLPPNNPYCTHREKNGLVIPNNIGLKANLTNIKPEEKFSDTTDSAQSPSSVNESNVKKNLLKKKRNRKQKKIYSALKTKKKVPMKNGIINKTNLSKSNDSKENEKNIKKKNLNSNKNVNLNKKEKSKNKEQPKKTQTNKNQPKEKQKSLKELNAQNEMYIIEQVNKQYSDIEFQKDLQKYSADEKSEFMKKNFPIMYRKDKYYMYTILLLRRRKETKYFLYPENLSKIRQHNNELQYQNLYSDFEILDESENKKENSKDSKGLENLDMKNDNLNEKNNENIYKKAYKTIPTKVWSYSEKNDGLDVEKFFDDCVQVWPFNECNFIKEIALEYLMKKKYDTKSCLGGLEEFVEFTKKRAVELDFAIQSENVKTVKKYNLRKTTH